jgi:hypothetical protein
MARGRTTVIGEAEILSAFVEQTRGGRRLRLRAVALAAEGGHGPRRAVEVVLLAKQYQEFLDTEGATQGDS